MDKSFHPTLYLACNYLSMLGLKLNHVSKRGHRCPIEVIVRRYRYCSITINSSPHICASELCKHWISLWLVAYLAPNHYLNQCLVIAIWVLEAHFIETLIKIIFFSFTKMHLKMSSATWQPFCPGGDGVNGF